MHSPTRDDVDLALRPHAQPTKSGKPQLVVFTLQNRPRQTRARTPRTRTGCKQCKRRHRKCDEGRPSCQACLDKGLVCDGYWVRGDLPAAPGSSNKTETGQGAVAKAGKPVDTRILSMVGYDSAIFTDQQDFDYFHSFVYACQQDGCLPIADLVMITPQIAHSEASIRLLGSASGANIMAMPLVYCNPPQGSPIAQALQAADRRSLMYTNRAINALRNARPTASNLRITVISAMMFSNFEMLRGNVKHALAHYNHTMLVLDQYFQVRCDESRTPFEKLRLDLVDEAIYDVYQRMGTYSWEFDYVFPMREKARPEYLPPRCRPGRRHVYRLGEMPSRFVDGKEAVRWWDTIQHFIMYHLDEPSDLSFDMPEPTGAQSTLEKRLSQSLTIVLRWHEAFEQLFHACRRTKDTHPQRYIQAITLEILYQETLARLYANRSAEDAQAVPSRSPLFREILHTAQVLLGQAKPLSDGGNKYIDNALINTLAFILYACRDSEVLDELQDLLLPRSGMDSPSTGLLGLMMNREEEKGPPLQALWRSWTYFLTCAGCRIGELDLH